MRQIFKILLLSFSISAVELGILYLLLEQEGRKEDVVSITDPLIANTKEWENPLTQVKSRDLLQLNTYRRFPINNKPVQQPRSDGRVYRR